MPALNGGWACSGASPAWDVIQQRLQRSGGNGLTPVIHIRGDQPAASARNNICTWDGRLDNREELLGRLGADCRGSAANGAIALAVYEKFGVGGFGDLIGDWSLAIWDESRRTLILASDYAGTRPLYYRKAEGWLCWASSLEELKAITDSHEISGDFVADILSTGSAFESTPYRGVYSVEPGTAACFEAGGQKSVRFWELPLHRETRLRRDEDYEEELRQLLAEAVRVRMDDGATVVAELSGGLDSTAVVCAANKLIREQPAVARSLQLVTYKEAGSIDERFIRAVETHCGLQAHAFDTETLPAVDPNRLPEAAPTWWEPRFRALRTLMEEVDAPVCLTGQLGDLVMGNWIDDAEQVADSLYRLHPVRAMREAMRWSSALHVPVYSIVWRACGEMWAPEPRGFRADLERGGAASHCLLSPNLESRASARTAARLQSVNWRQVLPSRRKRLWALADMLQARRLQCPAALLDRAYAHPYAHRPLVEFMMTIPPDLVCRPSQPRRLMRRALSDLLPPAVLKRRSKGSYEKSFLTPIVPMAAQLLQQSSLRLVDMGFVQHTALRTRLERFLHGVDSHPLQIRTAVLLEHWLRTKTA